MPRTVREETNMFTLRKSSDRGHANHGWLDTFHSFSFADYFDPKHMGFRVLRVINEDRVAAGAGFPKHPHRDMEILTYVIEGALAHTDTLGNSAEIRPGEVQRMSAGTGILHSEYNPSKTQATHLLQIWLLPEAQGLKPGYAQATFNDRFRQDTGLALAASRDGRDGSVTLQQDVNLYVGKPRVGEAARLPLRPGRAAWLQMIKGTATVGGIALSAGDGLAATEEPVMEIIPTADAEFLIFDLP